MNTTPPRIARLAGGAYRMDGDTLMHAPVNIDGTIDADAWYEVDENAEDMDEVVLARGILARAGERAPTYLEVIDAATHAESLIGQLQDHMTDGLMPNIMRQGYAGATLARLRAILATYERTGEPTDGGQRHSLARRFEDSAERQERERQERKFSPPDDADGFGAVHLDGGENADHPGGQCLIGEDGSTWLAEIVSPNTADDSAARRIAAAWNACEGIPTTELEAHGPELVNARAELATLKDAARRALSSRDEQGHFWTDAEQALADLVGGLHAPCSRCGADTYHAHSLCPSCERDDANAGNENANRAGNPDRGERPDDALAPKARLEYLRTQLRSECLSYGDVAELQGLSTHIEPGDVELLEAAGVPEPAAPLRPELDPASALRSILEAVNAHDAQIDDEANNGDEARPPEGDDYNDVVQVVREFAARAGIEATPPPLSRHLVVDGSDSANPAESCYAGDGQFPPFAIFNVDAQTNLPGTYATREAAEAALRTALAADDRAPLPGTFGATLAPEWLEALDGAICALPADCKVSQDCAAVIAAAETFLASLPDVRASARFQVIEAACEQCAVFHYG